MEKTPIAWAVYDGKTGILRYVERDEDRVRELVEEGGYEARPLFESSAPADDVRELVAEARSDIGDADRCIMPQPPMKLVRGRGDAEHQVTNALEASVRPYGTVTDTEVEAAQRVLDAHLGIGNKSVTRAALEAAREARS